MACSSAPVLNSEQIVFFATPGSQRVDEDAKTRYSTSQKIDVLIQELREKGPLVAQGRLGPKFYQAEPFELQHGVGGHRIFGWKPGTRSGSDQAIYALVIGAGKEDGRERVYFQLSTDRTTDQDTFIREHQSTEDKRVFVCSHETFRDNLVDLYPPAAQEKLHPNFHSAGSLHCSLEEVSYVAQLASIMPLDSILEDNEAACKTLGQAIFDHFKQANGNRTVAGKEAAVRICNALTTCAKDGRFRKQYVERAWNGIGDDTWRWLH